MLNAMTCDRCGHVEMLPMVVLTEEVGTDGGAQLVEALFYNAKRLLASQGWYTSVGEDLCPTCCKAEGKQPGYVENELAPDTVVVPNESCDCPYEKRFRIMCVYPNCKPSSEDA